jgi:methylglutaconyl-CoA hydratase
MKSVVVSEIDYVANVKLHRPDVRNAFNAEMIKELTFVFKSLQSRTDLRAVTLQGEGKVFCAGADLNWMSSMVKYSYDENIKDAMEHGKLEKKYLEITQK